MSTEELESLPAAVGWGQWSHESLLLAQIVDRLAYVEYAIVAVNSEKGKAPKPPQPMRRPGVGAPPGTRRERDDMVRRIAYLKALERNHGGKPTPEQVEAVMIELEG